MVPLILWDDTVFDATTTKLAPSAGGPGAGRGRGGAPEEPFAGRYTAVLLSPKSGPGKGARRLPSLLDFPFPACANCPAGPARFSSI